MTATIEFQVDRLRKEVKRLIRETKAVNMLTSPHTVWAEAEITAKKREIEKLSKTALRKLRDLYKRQMIRARRDYGITLSPEQLLEILTFIEAAPDGQVVWVPIWALRRWFTNSETFILPHSRAFYHAYVAIDPSGTIYPGKVPRFETRMLEASLFEDMSALFNLARDSHIGRRDDEPRKALKYRLALQRATVVAAFNVIEAYLNGLAFDYVETNRKSIDAETATLLTEWDGVRQRPRFISLREKLLSYPRVILGTKHAPLQESNCEELRFVIETAKKYRDSIVHSSPAPNLVSMEAEKEKAVHGVEFEVAERAVDATVSLICKLEETINGNRQRLEGWLWLRASNGMFPDVVFE